MYMSVLSILPRRNFWQGLRFTPESARAHYDEVTALEAELYYLKIYKVVNSIKTEDSEKIVV